MKTVKIIVTVTILSIAAVCAISPYAGENNGAWKISSDTDGIRIFTRPVSNSKLVEFKGESRTDVRIEVIAAVLLDIPGYTKWISFVSESKMIKKYSEDHFIVYQRFNFAWPYEDRDIITEVTITRDYKNGIFSGRLNAVDDISLVPEKKGCLRMKHLTGNIVVNYMNRNVTGGAISQIFDPAGNIPAWLANYISSQIPQVLLSNIRAEVKKNNRIRDAETSSIKKGIEESIQLGFLKE